VPKACTRLSAAFPHHQQEHVVSPINLHVPSAAITAGALPEIGMCPRHGEAATRSKDRTFFTPTPIWVYLLCVVSLLFGLIVLLVTRKKVTGPIPECATCVQQQSTRRRNNWIAWSAAIVLFVAGVTISNAAVAVVAFLALVAALLYSVLGTKPVQSGTVTKDRHWVELKHVAPAFSVAVQEKMALAAPEEVDVAPHV
jgi:choline-glycine betaine transporter